MSGYMQKVIKRSFLSFSFYNCNPHLLYIPQKLLNPPIYANILNCSHMRLAMLFLARRIWISILLTSIETYLHKSTKTNNGKKQLRIVSFAIPYRKVSFAEAPQEQHINEPKPDSATNSQPAANRHHQPQKQTSGRWREPWIKQLPLLNGGASTATVVVGRSWLLLKVLR